MLPEAADSLFVPALVMAIIVAAGMIGGILGGLIVLERQKQGRL